MIAAAMLLCFFCTGIASKADSNQPYSSSNDLSALSINCGALSPSFEPDITAYTVETDSIVNVNIIPVAADANATITINGKSCISGSNCYVCLSLDNNVISIAVTSQIGLTKYYTITVKAKAPTAAGLSQLSLSAGALSPAFCTDTTSYAVDVKSSVAAITLTPVALAPAQSITINNVEVASGGKFNLTLSDGTNTAAITVSQSDGETKTYLVTITREAASSIGLSGLYISPGTLSPAFSSGTLSYTASVASGTEAVTLVPTALDSTQTIAVNNTEITNGSGYNLALSDGMNTAAITVSQSDGETKTYVITITRSTPSDASSSTAGLSSLVISSGALSPSFSPDTLSYTATVENSVSRLYISAVASVPTAKIRINSSTSSYVSLAIGSNTITITVTAADSTVKTYTITVFRNYDTGITVTTQNEYGAYCATIPDYVSQLGGSDTVTFTLGGDTIVVPATTLESYKGSDMLTISRNESSQSTVQNAAGAALDNCTVAGGVDLTLSGGSSFACCPINANVVLKLKSGIKTALKDGVPEIYYYNTITGKLEDANAVFDMTAGTARFTALKTGTYVFAATLSGSSNSYTVTADTSFSGAGATRTFNVKITRGNNSTRLDNAQLMVVTTLSSGYQIFSFINLTGDDCEITVNVDGRAKKSTVYLINSAFDGRNIPKTYALTQFVSA